MAGVVRAPGAFSITPHKVSVCILVHSYTSPSQISVPFSSVSQHSRLGLYLLALTKSCDNILEPKLNQLINQLREIGVLMDDWLTDHVTSWLSSLSSPDDLFNFFNELRGVIDDDQVILDPNSNLGMFLRRCILAFNLLTFEAYASEVCSDEYRDLALSVVTSRGIGLIIGHAIGGFIAQLVEKYPNLFSKSSILGRFPYFLPCLIISVYFVGVLISCKWLPVSFKLILSSLHFLVTFKKWYQRIRYSSLTPKTEQHSFAIRLS
ncbi:hypothetical protein F3Y22_tig00002840pilonHSYRG00651 [Hibiscus syriacus]|uniref:Uncharacterized protein n=1 Tax=Hibiscus syriacus TaxID=106335 RepID=A0A6A3CQJ2_HIBSY|nr:hypothetical protein F3Y22_tig00002840pilonHSYRG00651 [Hibiscus syriacus]